MKVSERPEPEASEWQQEPGLYGRRYRIVGGIKEYEMDINGVPESVFFASQKAQKERDAAQREMEKREFLQRAALRRNCPFRTGIHTDCSREKCALFVSNGCILAQIASKPAADTAGRQCPFDTYRSNCRQDCALYKGGCALTGMIFERMENKQHEQI